MNNLRVVILIVVAATFTGCVTNTKEKAEKAEKRVRDMAEPAGNVVSVGCHGDGFYDLYKCSVMFDDGTVMMFECDSIYPERCAVKAGRIDVRVRNVPEDL